MQKIIIDKQIAHYRKKAGLTQERLGGQNKGYCRRSQRSFHGNYKAPELRDGDNQYD